MRERGARERESNDCRSTTKIKRGSTKSVSEKMNCMHREGEGEGERGEPNAIHFWIHSNHRQEWRFSFFGRSIRTSFELKNEFILIIKLHEPVRMLRGWMDFPGE